MQEENKIKKENDINKKYNNQSLFSIKQIIFFIFITSVFFISLLAITFKFGLEGEKDIKEKEELLKQQEEAAKWFDITVDENLCEQGFLVYNKEVYYWLYGATLFDKELIGDFLIECTENIYLKDGQYKYSVKEGFKFKNISGGKVYSFKNNDDIVLLMNDEKDIYIYAKESIYKNYEKPKIQEMHNNNFNNVKKIYLYSKNSFVPNYFLGEIEINKIKENAETFEYNFFDDNLLIGFPDYYLYDIFIEYNNIAYKYNALYKVVNNTLYIQEYIDEKTGISYGISSIVDFIKEIEY
jgi:hypothetical protein